MRTFSPILAPVLAAVAAAGCFTTTGGGRGVAGTRGDTEAWRVRLNWQTETELNAFGFYVHRAEEPGGPMKVINPDTPLHAAGTTTIPQRYRYYDLNVEAGKTYYYKLEQVDTDGSSHFIAGEDQPVPGESKRLSEDETTEIHTRGVMFREEAG